MVWHQVRIAISLMSIEAFGVLARFRLVVLAHDPLAGCALVTEVTVVARLDCIAFPILNVAFGARGPPSCALYGLVVLRRTGCRSD
jgi:hypothetical protein